MSDFPSKQRQTRKPEKRRQYTHSTQDLYDVDGASGETGYTQRDPGTPATPTVEQGNEDDEDDLNFVYNFDPHLDSSNYTGSRHREESVRMSTGAEDMDLQTHDRDTRPQPPPAAGATTPRAVSARAAMAQPQADPVAARPQTEPPSVGGVLAHTSKGSMVRDRPATLPQAQPAASATQVDLTPRLPIASESP